MYLRIALAVFCVMFSMLLAATAAGQATKPAVLPIVDVVTADGKTIHGRLTNADGLDVTIQPMAAGQEPQTIPWRDVKRISNGLTQQKAMDAWKTLHKDELCATCKGNRMVVCITCKGTGHDLASRKDCNSCKGAGVTACSVTGPRSVATVMLAVDSATVPVTEGNAAKALRSVTVRSPLAMPSSDTGPTSGANRRSPPTAVSESAGTPARRASRSTVDASRWARPSGSRAELTSMLNAQCSVPGAGGGKWSPLAFGCEHCAL